MQEQPARIFGREYGVLCYNKDQCESPSEAYVVVAQTFGQPGEVYRPAIKLTMSGALPDDERNAIGKSHSRPAIAGTQPPPLDEAMKVFNGVVRSIRLRPGAVLSTAGSPYAQQRTASSVERQLR